MLALKKPMEGKADAINSPKFFLIFFQLFVANEPAYFGLLGWLFFHNITIFAS